MRDFLRDDLGVTLLLRMVLTGVDRSFLEGGESTGRLREASVLAEAAERAEGEGLALEFWTASLGVMGGFAEANRGRRGLFWWFFSNAMAKQGLYRGMAVVGGVMVAGGDESGSRERGSRRVGVCAGWIRNGAAAGVLGADVGEKGSGTGGFGGLKLVRW